jgi:hypothetical protein
LNAFAFKVVVAASIKGVLYKLDLEVGSLPSVVYRIVAPLIAHNMVTVTDPVYVPGAGLNVGMAMVIG